jgi:hypothetical protein
MAKNCQFLGVTKRGSSHGGTPILGYSLVCVGEGCGFGRGVWVTWVWVRSVGVGEGCV